MKILMIAHFSPIPGDGGNGRFIYLLNKFRYPDDCVEFVTSAFLHGTKDKCGSRRA